MIMQLRQLNRKQYFNEQSYTTEKYVIPFINSNFPIISGLNIIEVGCGEGGNLKPFIDLGCFVTGIDISKGKIENAKEYYNSHPLNGNLMIILNDIYEYKENVRFDLIILRDTLEHITNQDKLLKHLKNFLNPNGKIFISFPPWRMPFGGHQQMSKSKLLSQLPYLHLLPFYKSILRMFGESDKMINALMEIKKTRLSIYQFHRIIKENNYKIDVKNLYLINPNYEVKFKMKPRKLPFYLNIPYIRDYFTTTIYTLISEK